MIKEGQTVQSTRAPKLTINIFDPLKGPAEYVREIKPLFKGSTLKAYDLILSGQRGSAKPEKTKVDESYLKISKNNGNQSRGSRFLRRLDINFFKSLGTHYDRDGIATSEEFFGKLLHAANTFKDNV